MSQFYHPIIRLLQISKAILAAFGRDTDGAQWTIGFLLEKILSNLSAWSSEEALLTDTLNLLVAMLEKKHRCDYVVRCQTIWKLAKDVSANQPPYDILSPMSKRRLYRGLVLAGGATFEGDTKENYWKLVSLCFKNHIIFVITFLCKMITVDEKILVHLTV